MAPRIAVATRRVGGEARWVVVGMLESERSFRRITGCAEMSTLVAAIRREVNRRTAIDETVTRPEYDQAVA